MQSTPAGAGAQRRGTVLGRATSVGSAHSSDSGHFGSLQLFCSVCLALQGDVGERRQEHVGQREVERRLLESAIDMEGKRRVTEVESLEARLQDFRERLEEKEKYFRERLEDKEERFKERLKEKERQPQM